MENEEIKKTTRGKVDLESYMEAVISQDGSDLHLTVGSHPIIRATSELIPLVNEKILTQEDMLLLVDSLMRPEQKENFLRDQEVDFSYSFKNKARFRGNGYVERGKIGIALRLIPTYIRTLEELNLPPYLASFADKRQGFFLVVGPVGQGKSTTLASIVELINQKQAKHIITIEDPIEYVFEEKKSIIAQREVRVDTKDFPTALRAAFRQDVNVLMVGEMRELETISTAVTAAETGHLVLSTLHTNNAAQTIDRIIDSFPSTQQDQIRLQLAASLAGIFSQRLIPRIAGGLVPAYELLVNNSAVSNLIRERRTHEVNTIIETSSEDGMIDMNRSLADLVRRGEITPEDAFRHSLNPQVLERLL